jgi:hypothetical protein
LPQAFYKLSDFVFLALGAGLLYFGLFWFDPLLGAWLFDAPQLFWALRGMVLVQGVLLTAIGVYWLARDRRQKPKGNPWRRSHPRTKY